MRMNPIVKKSFHRIGKTSLALFGLVEGTDYLYRTRYPYHIRPFYESTLTDRITDVSGVIQEMGLNIDWVPEEFYRFKMANSVWPYLSDHCHKGQLAREGYDLSYAIYLPNQIRARLVLVHGLNEFKEKYAEIIYYLLQVGIAVYTYDSRGHGDSKIKESDQVVDLTDFQIMVEDLHALVNHWQVGEESFSLYGHSMGGAIATAYSQKYPQTIRNLILSSPMIGIYTHGLKRSSTHLLAELACRFGHGQAEVPQKGNAYKQRAMFYDPNNVCSNSNIRGFYAYWLNRQLHAYPTYIPSMNWLKASLFLDNQINQLQGIKQMTFPVTIFKAECDRLVDNRAMDHLASFLPQGHVVLVEDSKHEIFTHHDPVVQAYTLTIIEETLQAHAKSKGRE